MIQMLGWTHDLLAGGENVLQYKAGNLTKALLTDEFMKPGVQTTLRNGGHYLFCAGRDYVSKDVKRLRRWVGRRLPGDFDAEHAFEAADQEVLKLAEEGFRNDIGTDELQWLSSPEAENVWLFGRRLGELDTPETFRERIISFAPNNVNCMLLASYISGRGIVAGSRVRNQLLDSVALQKPAAAFGAIWRGEPTNSGAELIIKLVSDARVAGSELRVLMYGGWVEKLGPEHAARIVRLILKSSSGENVEAVLGIIDHAVHSSALSVEQFGDLIWDALGTKVSQRSPMFDWYWGRVADLVVEVAPARFAQQGLAEAKSSHCPCKERRDKDGTRTASGNSKAPLPAQRTRKKWGTSLFLISC